MNKYQEALDHIIKCDREDSGISYLSDAYRNDILLLKELVDKATPTKAIQKENKDVDGYIYYERVCPNCKKYVDKYAEYCIFCNQKLDWSDEDDK